MPEKSLAHTKWDCTYHIVFIPKYRRLGIIKRLCQDMDVEMVEGAMCPDHIHMSLRIPPRLSVAYVMGYLKGKSALKLFDENPGLRRLTGKDRTLWARGYYVSTVGINEDVIRKYIKEQEEADQFGAAD